LVADLPGARLIHQQFSELVEWKYELMAGEQWIEYNGTRLYADTSDRVAKMIDMHGEYEPRTTKIIKNNLDSGDFAIDIGAHIGHHTTTMRQCVESGGCVWAFEPNPRNADYIRTSLKQSGWSNVELFELALSNSESSAQLLIPTTTNTGTAAISDANLNTANSKETYSVEMKKLTSIINKRNIENINLLKIDVEGGETSIIEDLNGHLNNIETIILEFHTQIIDEKQVTKTFEILKKSGEIMDFEGNPISINRALDEKINVIWHSK
jgi:FkbM family methyltransferase